MAYAANNYTRSNPRAIDIDNIMEVPVGIPVDANQKSQPSLALQFNNDIGESNEGNIVNHMQHGSDEESSIVSDDDVELTREEIGEAERNLEEKLKSACHLMGSCEGHDYSSRRHAMQQDLVEARQRLDALRQEYESITKEDDIKDRLRIALREAIMSMIDLWHRKQVLAIFKSLLSEDEISFYLDFDWNRHNDMSVDETKKRIEAQVNTALQRYFSQTIGTDEDRRWLLSILCGNIFKDEVEMSFGVEVTNEEWNDAKEFRRIIGPGQIPLFTGVNVLDSVFLDMRSKKNAFC